MKIDLKFYEGYRSDTQFFYRGEMINGVPWEKSCYPVPSYVGAPLPPILNVSTSNFRVSYKIQNNNFLNGNVGSEALYLATTATVLGGGESLDIDLRVATKSLLTETSYTYELFNFTATGDGPIVGNFKGLTAFAMADNYVDRYFVGFIGAVASYIYSNDAPALPVEDQYVQVNIKIIDIAYNVIDGLIYLIDESNLYSMNFPTPGLTQITTLPSNLINYTSLIIDINGTAYISCQKGERQSILVYETASTNNATYDSPFDSETVGIKLRYGRIAENLVGSKRPIMLISLGEGFGLANNFNASTAPSWQILNTTNHPFLKSNVINDMDMKNLNNAQNITNLVVATEGGVALGAYEALFDAAYLYNSGALSNDEATTITFGNAVIPAVGNSQFSYVYGSVTSKGVFRFSATEADSDAVTATVVRRDSVDLPTQVATVWCMPLGTIVPTGNSYWIGCYLGKGIRGGQFVNDLHTTLNVQVVSENYNFELRDFLKADIYTYYFLFNEVGSSEIDANSVLASFDAETNTFITGAPGYFLPSDRLWLAGETFLFRNSENKNTFYYKESPNLSIDTVEANIISSEGTEGLISATYAGEITDIITTVDQFYLLGSRGIEVWQNVGAAGFPYRKENYLSVPYHLLPLSDEDTYFIPISRWTYYKGSYVIVSFSNEADVFNLIQIKNGQYKKMMLDETLFYTLMGDENVVRDMSLNAVNWWGKTYLLLGVVTESDNGIVSNYFLISEDNRWAKINDFGNIFPFSEVQYQFILTTTMNSLATRYNTGADSFEAVTASRSPNPLPDPLTTPFRVDSIKIEGESEFILLNRILIHVEFPIFNLAFWPPDATYTVSISEDGGRTFNVIEGPMALTVQRRQIECSYEKAVLEAIIRFECNYPLVVAGGIAYYEKGGIL